MVISVRQPPLPRWQIIGDGGAAREQVVSEGRGLLDLAQWAFPHLRLPPIPERDGAPRLLPKRILEPLVRLYGQGLGEVDAPDWPHP